MHLMIKINIVTINYKNIQKMNLICYQKKIVTFSYYSHFIKKRTKVNVDDKKLQLLN